MVKNSLLTKLFTSLQNVNPGLSRRFAIDNAFEFEDYDDDELLRALDFKLKDQDLSATPEAKRVASEVLSRQRNRPNFGNIGAVENLLSMAKSQMQKRNADADAPFEPQDFDPDYLRGQNANENLTKLFEDTIGSEDVVAQLRRYQKMAESCKARNIDPREMTPTNFVFKGPPGMFNNYVILQALITHRYWKDHDSAEDGPSLFRHGLPFQ